MIFRKKFALAVLVPLSFGISVPGSASPVVYSKPKLENRSTGILETRVAGEWYRGSGVVARDPRLIYSCAHMFYDEGAWATRSVFHRAWNDRQDPRPSQGAAVRGYYAFSTYAAIVDRRGAETNRAFDSDFTILYGNRPFGAAMPVTSKGGAAVRSPRSKHIVGYPAVIDFTGKRGFAFQHSTGPFGQRAVRFYDSYFEFRGVSTGSGNSGGPVFVKNKAGKDVLAGILVSGWRRMAGVRALDKSSESLAKQVLGAETKALKFANRNRVTLVPGGESSWTERAVVVRDVDGVARRLSMNMSVSAADGASYDAFLRSPGGSVRWIRRAGRSGGESGIDLSDRFGGIDPNGTWTLHLRAAPDSGEVVFENFSITFDAL